MARILLCGFDECTAAQLAFLLQAGRHHVQVYGAIDICSRLITEPNPAIDLIVLDGTAIPDSVGKCFKDIAGLYAYRRRKALLLCVSRVYHGPRFEIDLENEGARLVYVH